MPSFIFYLNHFNLTQNSDFMGFELGTDFYKTSILLVKFRFFSVYSDFLSHSFTFCVISKWLVYVLPYLAIILF